MTLPQLLVWLPRHSAMRRVVTARPPSHYTYSHHVNGTPGRDVFKQHVVKLSFSYREASMEYYLNEAFVNGVPLRSTARLAAWGLENNDFFEEVIDAAADNVQYSAQLNTDPVMHYTGPPLTMPSLLTPPMLHLLNIDSVQ